ncbi:hypothetical protein SPONL_954 [uncultured Candidatus Thioglobus sp.]|nr:hypothetical protein SPONL_954 [uncultured Candidatus Thioglobus sp.]
MIEQDAKDIQKVMGEISDAFTRIAAQREFIKEAIAALSEKYMIEKKTLNKVAKIVHKQNIAEISAENTNVEELYEDITIANRDRA